MRTPARDRPLSTAKVVNNVLAEGLDSNFRPPRTSNSRESDELDFQSTDFGADALEFSAPPSDHSPTSSSPRANVSIIKKMEPLIE